MPAEPSTQLPAKTKRARKSSTTKRVRQPKPQAILDIESVAKAAKAKYRLAQSSGGVLKRICEKMIPKLTPEHCQSLYDALSATETPKLLEVDSAREFNHERRIGDSDKA